ncbi:MAG: hypothetical protein NWE96_08620 [Candidatus Bathyarchaeota archaeon]|nr:hypothetical protein [Candidatus Bathyarchaeota archaeon]
MQCENKLKEARFFFNKLEKIMQDTANEEEFLYFLSAFLCSWRSVIDVMLYDYADKYHFGFSREENLVIRDFEVAARVTNNADATQFIQWLLRQQGNLSNNPLWRKRNIIIHRGYPDIVYQVYTSGSMAFSSSFVVAQPTAVNGTSLLTRQDLETPALAGSAVPTSVTNNVTPTNVGDITFHDCPDRSALDYCREALKQMEDVVASAFQQFGR